MKSIVVPVNFTAHSRNGARYAAEMALALEADIHLLHVERIPMSPAEVPAGFFFQQLQKSAEASLAELAAELTGLTRHQIAVTTILETGNLQFKLQEVCDRLKPFVVVMGIQQEPQLRDLHGSDTMNAVRHLGFPLLAIPADIRFYAIRKIALACNPEELREGMPASLDFLEELRNLFAARLEIISVKPPTGKGSGPVEPGEWKAFAHLPMPEITFVKAANVEEGIMNYLNCHAVDWLIVFPRQHGFLDFHRSHSIRIVRRSAIPVMSLGEAIEIRQPN